MSHSSLPVFVLITFAFTAVSSTLAVAQTPAHHIVKFDAPGAGTGSGQGTTPFQILNDGTILGEFIDSGNVYHGFLRSASGTFTQIDAPGAGTGPGQGTFPAEVNSALTVVGYYFDSSGVSHGFLRSPEGTFTTVDDPTAGTASGQGTLALDINTGGLVAGFYIDSSGVDHGFFRSTGGTFRTFDDPLAGTGSGQGTGISGACGLTDAGAVAGGYVDSVGETHGYLRSPSGTFTTIDPVGSVNTFVIGLSSNQTVAGIYFDSSGSFQAFTYLKGVTTPYEAPNAVDTGANNINPQGIVAGGYFDSRALQHGYVRSASGAFFELSIPGASGTADNFINSINQITGVWQDANNATHGFMFE